MKPSIRSKLVLVCGVLLGAMALTTVLGIRDLNAGNERADRISSVYATAAQLTSQLRGDTGRIARIERDLVLAIGDDHRTAVALDLDRSLHDRDERRRALRAIGDPAIADQLKDIAEHTGEMTQVLAAIDHAVTTPEERRLAGDVHASYAAFADVHGKARKLASENTGAGSDRPTGRAGEAPSIDATS
jgi:hypothetical protein